MLMSSTIGKIAAALVKAQTEMGSAVKDSKNPFFKSSYADLNAVREACIPSLNKHGISALQPTVVVDGKKYVQTTLVHESGEFLAALTEILFLKEGDPQAQGSGISYARRYGLQSFLNIGSEDDDSEKAMGRASKGAPASANVPAAAASVPASSKEQAGAAPKPSTASSSFRRPVANGAGLPAASASKGDF